MDLDNMIDPELIIFAAVAIFVLTRLFSVLGKNEGAPPPPSIIKEATEKRLQDVEDPQDDEQALTFTGPGASGMEEIAAVDKNFHPDGFVRGAKKAYEMIVAAFAEGNKSSLSELLDDDVFEAYSQAIDEREKEGREPFTLLRLKSAEIADAELTEQGVARLMVSFEAELSDGEYQRVAKEIWTFERVAKSRDPNWRLSEVSAAS